MVNRQISLTSNHHNPYLLSTLNLFGTRTKKLIYRLNTPPRLRLPLLLPISLNRSLQNLQSITTKLLPNLRLQTPPRSLPMSPRKLHLLTLQKLRPQTLRFSGVFLEKGDYVNVLRCRVTSREPTGEVYPVGYVACICHADSFQFSRF
jgi:hypothetical protein